MEKWLILAALGALSIWMWIVGGRQETVAKPSPAGRPLRTHARTAPPEPDDASEPRPARAMRLSRCARCGAWRVEGARCHDSRGYPRG